MKTRTHIKTDPTYDKVGGNFWEVASMADINVIVDDLEKFFFRAIPNFHFNFRSGPWIVGAVAPRIGKYEICWLCHDVAYESHGISKELADKILDAMLLEYGMNRFSRWIVRKGLSGKVAAKAWENQRPCNIGLASCGWVAR